MSSESAPTTHVVALPGSAAFRTRALAGQKLLQVVVPLEACDVYRTRYPVGVAGRFESQLRVNNPEDCSMPVLKLLTALVEVDASKRSSENHESEAVAGVRTAVGINR